MKRKKGSSKNTYQLYVTLFGIEPQIWRRILVPGSMILRQFHDVLQIAFGWEDYHLHSFRTKKKYYEDAEMNPEAEGEDERKFKLNELLLKQGSSMIYEYDFGDGWELHIVLEKILPFDAKQKAPVCLEGERSAPPEDCGGIWGYSELLEAIKDSSHPEHEEMLEWVGEDFDPECFDLKEINKDLSEIN